jgi:hypothetical protein
MTSQVLPEAAMSRRKSTKPLAFLLLGFSVATVPLWSQTSTSSAAPHTASKPRTAATVVYINRKYGFRFYLPRSWAGYTILEDTSNANSGNEIRIRHPLWTEENPREDIPIWIFTRQQWREIEQEKLIVTAAPFPPGELGRNKKFVFAVMPRWYYDFSDGWEECQSILGNGLKAFDP